jgi:hypothetical protein
VAHSRRGTVIALRGLVEAINLFPFVENLKMRLNLVGGLLTVTLAGVVPSLVGAQSFTAFGAPANGTSNAEFWNRTSDDNVVARGSVCNVGAVLTNTSLVPADCDNESPSNLLPYTAVPTPNTYLNNAGAATPFYFGAGDWTVNLVGRLAGANPARPVSIYDALTDNLLYANISSLSFFAVNGFYLSISAYSPFSVDYTSNSSSGPIQFGVFTNGTGADLTQTELGTRLNGNTGRTYFGGAEDDAMGDSDYDYNDVIFQVQTVPEPSTYALFATGLAALAIAARRRRTQA